MSSLLHRALASDNRRVAQAVEAAGRMRDRLDHPQLRDARRLLTATPDVLLMGESVLDFVGPDDADRRNLPTMVADDLGASLRTLAVHGGGYHVELLTEYLRLVAARPSRPKVVVVPLWVRGRLRPWIVHPRFGHVDAMHRLRALDPSRPAWRVRGSLKRATREDFEAYYRISHPSLIGDLAIGEYARPLKGTALSEQERLTLLYAFHHGGRVEDLEAVTNLGHALLGLGVRFFAYETPLSVETGERVLGPALRATAEANFAAMAAAFRTGAGDDAVVLATGTSFAEDEFINPRDGSEHLNERGRRRLSALIADQVRARL